MDQIATTIVNREFIIELNILSAFNRLLLNAEAGIMDNIELQDSPHSQYSSDRYS
jgi:hypothetical protein